MDRAMSERWVFGDEPVFESTIVILQRGDAVLWGLVEAT